jgi:nitroimidazol reductase NimA-like FMN-containing flavoprotein (pyridoxamine 5'-phosphate oxidase superfamily)
MAERHVVTDKPRMPAAYGMGAATSAPGERLTWERAKELLAASRNYWVCTTRPDGRPHAMPVWGIWLDGSLYFSTGRDSRKALNLATNANAVVHTESGDEAVIVEGTAEEVRDVSIMEQVLSAYEKKYGLRPDLSALDSVFYVVKPRVVFGWLEPDFPESATRWRIKDGG